MGSHRHDAAGRVLPLLPGTARRYWLGAAFSSPSPIVLITVLYFSAVAVIGALPECFAFFKQSNAALNISYLIGLNADPHAIGRY
jgi:hypothetical protein